MTCTAVCNALLPSLYRQECDISGGVLREGAATDNQPKKTPSANIEGGRDFPALTTFPSHPLGSASTNSCSGNTGFGSNKVFLPGKIMAGQILTEALPILSDILFFATFSNYVSRVDTHTSARTVGEHTSSSSCPQKLSLRPSIISLERKPKFIG